MPDSTTNQSDHGTKTVSLFVTCLVDQFFPNVGEATVQVLKRASCEVTFDNRQTCCGQPAFNTGYREEARVLAKRFIEIFEPAEYIVAPSGSCTAMVRNFYPELFTDEPEWHERAKSVGAKTFELAEFLTKVLGIETTGALYNGKVTYHDACHLLRELRQRNEPRRLINSVEGVELVEAENCDTCCGFGGTFSVKYPEISGAMLNDKIKGIEQTGAEIVVADDCSCLMQIAGGLSRQGIKIRTMHLAELLAQNPNNRLRK
ncbi:MAG TPA: (Fe-S)-binding protein [Blastocatellia bacterium]|nr:(Fe-S)-binding protein [Blastocatellia bacterium]